VTRWLDAEGFALCTGAARRHPHTPNAARRASREGVDNTNLTETHDLEAAPIEEAVYERGQGFPAWTCESHRPIESGKGFVAEILHAESACGMSRKRPQLLRFMVGRLADRSRGETPHAE
jgi:hypothetical protein